MQLSLLSTAMPRPRTAAAAPTRTPARDAAAMSQLDRIAAAHAPASSHDGLGGSAWLVAVVGGLMLMGGAALWRSPPPDEPAAARSMTVQPLSALTPVATPAPTLPLAEVPTVVAAEPAPPEALPEALTALAEPAAAAEEAQRKARLRQAAEARRKAAQLAQEKAAADETQQQQQQAQRVAAERERAEEQARQRAAAEAARPQMVAMAEARRGVRELCAASGNFFSEQLCQSRECRKAEHQGEALCVRLREIDEARRLSSVER